MGDEAFDEVIIAARRGTLFIRGGYGREEVWLGLATAQGPEGDPDIMIELTPLMRQRLIEALTTMPAVPSELCWFCEATIELPIDRFGGVHGDREIVCHQCRATLKTTEDEDGDENLIVTLAPVRCGHGIDHLRACPMTNETEPTSDDCAEKVAPLAGLKIRLVAAWAALMGRTVVLNARFEPDENGDVVLRITTPKAVVCSNYFGFGRRHRPPNESPS